MNEFLPYYGINAMKNSHIKRNGIFIKKNHFHKNVLIFKVTSINVNDFIKIIRRWSAFMNINKMMEE